MKRLFGLLLTIAVALTATAATAETDTPAQQAILLDYATGMTLMEKNADERMHPSSMSKLMTLYVLFERLADGRLNMNDTFSVSEKAWRMGGSKMFVEVGTQVRVEDLIRGIIVQSGNDACIVVAEGISGSEEAFANLLNEKAVALGMTNSHFVNASGWPDDDHLTTVRDLATLARHLITDFPQYYHFFDEKSFTYSDIKQGNRNPLLYTNIGADGLKTGHTEAGGFGLVASAERDGQRLILVVNGLESVTQRARESERLLQWAFREFGRYSLFKAGETVDDAGVWLGKSPTVPLVIEQPLDVVMARKSRKDMKIKVVYDGPVPAPIEQGQAIGVVRVEAPDFTTVERPLVAGAAVPQLGMFGRINAAVEHLLFGAASR